MTVIARLLLALPIIAIYLVCAAVMILGIGCAWIFTGEASISLTWPKLTKR